HLNNPTNLSARQDRGRWWAHPEAITRAGAAVLWPVRHGAANRRRALPRDPAPGRAMPRAPASPESVFRVRFRSIHTNALGAEGFHGPSAFYPGWDFEKPRQADAELLPGAEPHPR